MGGTINPKIVDGSLGKNRLEINVQEGGINGTVQPAYTSVNLSKYRLFEDTILSGLRLL